MNKYYFACYFFLLLTLTSFAQEISIVVYKGKVSFDRENYLLPKSRYVISPTKSVHYETGSEFVIFSKQKMYKKVSGDGATINYKQILDNLKVNAPSSFYRLMLTYHEIGKVNTEAKGSAIGAAKGLNDKKDKEQLDKEEIIKPIDSAKTGSNSIVLDWKLNNSILNGRLYVIHELTRDTLINEPATHIGKKEVNLEKTGSYQWFIYSKSDKKKRINQTLIKLDAQEINKMQQDFTTFKEALSQFNAELQAILIEEYKIKNGIIE